MAVIRENADHLLFGLVGGVLGVRILELTTRMQPVQRSNGDSATAKAAYRACCVIACEREQRTHDYSRKQGLEAAEIVLPDAAPAWARDRAQLWNAAELRERNGRRGKNAGAFRANAQVARDYLFSYPAELSAAGRQTVARAVARHLTAAHGVAVDYAIHWPGEEGDERNFHCHMMFTTRRMTAAGLAEKTREWDERGKAGADSLAKRLRAFVARALNDALTAEGQEAAAFVEHRSFAARGLPQKPQTHQGPGGTHVLRKKQRQERQAWARQLRAEQRDRQAKEMAALKLRQDFSLQRRQAEWAQRMKEGAAAIKADLARQRQADSLPTGLRKIFALVTGKAMRDAFARQEREGVRVSAALMQMAELKAGLRAEGAAAQTAQARERDALAGRHARDDRQLEQAIQQREKLDRAREWTGRTAANDAQHTRGTGRGRSMEPDMRP